MSASDKPFLLTPAVLNYSNLIWEMNQNKLSLLESDAAVAPLDESSSAAADGTQLSSVLSAPDQPFLLTPAILNYSNLIWEMNQNKLSLLESDAAVAPLDESKAAATDGTQLDSVLSAPDASSFLSNPKQNMRTLKNWRNSRQYRIALMHKRYRSRLINCAPALAASSAAATEMEFPAGPPTVDAVTTPTLVAVQLPAEEIITNSPCASPMVDLLPMAPSMPFPLSGQRFAAWNSHTGQIIGVRTVESPSTVEGEATPTSVTSMAPSTLFSPSRHDDAATGNSRSTVQIIDLLTLESPSTVDGKSTPTSVTSKYKYARILRHDGPLCPRRHKEKWQRFLYNVRVLCGDGSAATWEPLNAFKKKAPKCCAEYAAAHGLRGERGWM